MISGEGAQNHLGVVRKCTECLGRDDAFGRHVIPTDDGETLSAQAPGSFIGWRWRFATHRMESLRDEARSGAPRTLDDARIEEVIIRTLEGLLSDATHWNSRSMARASGVSVTSVKRIWRAFSLQPHRVEATDDRCC